MTPFEFVFGLISIITSLALAHLTAGIVALIRHGERVRFSWRHAAWTWVAFALVIANWAGLWHLRAFEVWPFHLIAMNIAFMISLYAFCALVIPDIPPQAELDLRAFHDREGKRYIAAHMVFAVLACVYNAVGASSPQAWLRSSFLALLALAVSAVAFIARPLWLQGLAAAGMAVLAGYFLVAFTHIGQG